MSGTSHVILVEDEEQVRIATAQALELAGFDVAAFADAEQALAHITRDFDGAVVSDIRMPRMDGLELLTAIALRDRDIPVILVTGHGDVAMEVKALHDGAFDFLTKPFATDHLVARVRRALDRRALTLDNRRLRAAMETLEAADSLIGESAAIKRLRAAIRQVAQADLDVLVEGETGVGKELVARLLHREGPRRGRSFIAVNCGALSEANAEIELFGHAADSVAQTRLSRDGLVAASDGGTLLLDEVDSMPMAVQAKLLRTLEEREVQPIGADRPVAINLRVVATTKTDLAAASAAGLFRADLYYRLAQSRLTVPPLRDRQDDRQLLFAAFLTEARESLGRSDFEPDAAAHLHLAAHDWPGNARELRNYAYHSVLSDDDAIAPAQPAVTSGTLAERVAAYEAALIRDALLRHAGSVQSSIAELGLPRKTFYDKVARHGLNPAAFRRK